MLKIGEFSKLTQTTIKTLRYYEKEDILKPSYIDEYNGYRYYESSQVIPFNKILSLRQLGLSIEDIKNIQSGADINEYLDKRKSNIENEIIKSNDQLTRIKLILEDKENDYMKYEVVIKDIPAYTVFYKEGVIARYQDVGEFVLLAGEQVAKSNPDLKCLEPDYCFMEYLDGEYREANIKARYSQAVEKAGIENSDIKFKLLPAVTVASVYHRGAYDNFRDTYGFILKWVEDNGYEITDNIRESYIDGIWNKEDVSDWLTEIQVPIKKK
jgi:DNA-binding transcriptional MerR regulator